MKYDVFISYSRKDYADENKQVIQGNVISQIKELFDSNGISYWFDEDGVFSGDAFAPVIARNIKASKIFLFISSENSNASEWTSNEIATAHAYKKKIIPFRFDDSAYNESVIMYIARLDFIEYQANQSKSLSRLLNSVQTYLKAELDKKERERQEEERLRQAEISRQERATKLQNLRERIEHLENRKFDIEKEILAQEKSLADLRNEKRILESNIVELQEEEATLLGHSRTKKGTGKTEGTKIEHEKTIKEPRLNPNIFVREWSELKSAMALKHWSVNLLCLIWIIVAVFCFGGFTLACVLESYFYLSFVVAAYFAMIGGYKLLKNFRNGYTWLLIASLFLILPFIKGGWDEVLIAISVCVFTVGICTSFLLIRKNGTSAWSLLKKETQPIKKHKIQISIAGLLLLAFVVNWAIQERRLLLLKGEYYSADSAEQKGRIKNDALRVSYDHPFYDYWNSDF